MSSPTVWCPSCGAEYQAGSLLCSDCRVALVSTPPSSQPGTGDAWGVRAEQTSDDDLMELGSWPRLPAQILRRRLESAGLSVMVEWTGPGPEAEGTIVVPASQAEFASAIVNELDVDDEVPDTSPLAYVVRVEEHLAVAGQLLEELRTRLDEQERDGAS
ncbi:MAG TPA: hypothetical protein VF441_06145 [Acidimicrobiia bacterium]